MVFGFHTSMLVTWLNLTSNGSIAIKCVSIVTVDVTACFLYRDAFLSVTYDSLWDLWGIKVNIAGMTCVTYFCSIFYKNKLSKLRKLAI